MEKYKVCPYCGKHNKPKMLECIYCETDLSNVRVADEETESQSNEEQETISLGRIVRVCECGYKNDVNVRKCAKCGEDISDIIPTEEAQTNVRCVLASLDGGFAFEIIEKSNYVGRESGMSEYLQNKPYVSRKHAELIHENDRFYIRNISQTNYTYVNNIKIPQERYELHDGDEIGLGGNNVNGSRQRDAAYFQIRIGTCI